MLAEVQEKYLGALCEWEYVDCLDDLIVFAQFMLVPEMSFSDNALICFIGLIVCFAVAEKFKLFLTDGKSMTMVIFALIVIFIIVVDLMSFFSSV